MNELIAEYAGSTGAVIRMVQGDITEERVDAIVNAANEMLAHGGGVAGAIVRKGGAVIQHESNDKAPVPTGKAAITHAGALPCRYVIHAVGPVWHGGDRDEERLLQAALLSALDLADRYELTSISLPAISSGIFGFPKDLCAEILLSGTEQYLDDHPQSTLKEVRFCLYDRATISVFEDVWAGLFA